MNLSRSSSFVTLTLALPIMRLYLERRHIRSERFTEQKFFVWIIFNFSMSQFRCDFMRSWYGYFLISGFN